MQSSRRQLGHRAVSRSARGQAASTPGIWDLVCQDGKNQAALHAKPGLSVPRDAPALLFLTLLLQSISDFGTGTKSVRQAVRTGKTQPRPSQTACTFHRLCIGPGRPKKINKGCEQTVGSPKTRELESCLLSCPFSCTHPAIPSQDIYSCLPSSAPIAAGS